jgi:hypothetical protein
MMDIEYGSIEKQIHINASPGVVYLPTYGANLAAEAAER